MNETLSKSPLKPTATGRVGDATVSAGKPRQLDALTGVRGLAAVWVVTYHFANPEHRAVASALRPLLWIFERGDFAVPLFFILSGFILVYSYHDRFLKFSWAEYRRFLWLRLARIYPAYIVALAAVVCLFGNRLM